MRGENYQRSQTELKENIHVKVLTTLVEGNIKVQPNFSEPDKFQRFYIH